ncbi:unnamed protein product [Agarophyton chilense]
MLAQGLMSRLNSSFSSRSYQNAFLPIAPNFGVLRRRCYSCVQRNGVIRYSTAGPPPSSSDTAKPSQPLKTSSNQSQPLERGDKLLVVGLGNPGPRFENTRHNVGFSLLDQYAARHAAGNFRKQPSVQGEVVRFQVYNRSVMLLKPNTFMNASGRAVRAALKYLNAPVSALLVIVDDMSLPIGDLRLRGKGSAGGHNGLKSIQQSVGGVKYARLRIGVGSPRRGSQEWADFVLGPFSKGERKAIEGVEWDVMEAIDFWVQEPSIEKVQNQIALTKQN